MLSVHIYFSTYVYIYTRRETRKRDKNSRRGEKLTPRLRFYVWNVKLSWLLPPRKRRRRRRRRLESLHSEFIIRSTQRNVVVVVVVAATPNTRGEILKVTRKKKLATVWKVLHSLGWMYEKIFIRTRRKDWRVCRKGWKLFCIVSTRYTRTYHSVIEDGRATNKREEAGSKNYGWSSLAFSLLSDRMDLEWNE